MPIVLYLSTTALAIFRLILPNEWRLIKIDFMCFSHKYLILTHERKALIELS